MKVKWRSEWLNTSNHKLQVVEIAIFIKSSLDTNQSVSFPVELFIRIVLKNELLKLVVLATEVEALKHGLVC